MWIVARVIIHFFFSFFLQLIELIWSRIQQLICKLHLTQLSSSIKDGSYLEVCLIFYFFQVYNFLIALTHFSFLKYVVISHLI